MARKPRRKIGGPMGVEESLVLGESLFQMQRYHARRAEAGGHMITKFEGQIEIAPDLYVVSGKAKGLFREFVADIIAKEERGLNELERLYKLEGKRGDDGTGKPKSVD